MRSDCCDIAIKLDTSSREISVVSSTGEDDSRMNDPCEISPSSELNIVEFSVMEVSEIPIISSTARVEPNDVEASEIY